MYWLPPELVTLLQEHLREHAADPERAGLPHARGPPLVTGGSDAVRQAWDDWRVRANLERPGVGFYSLRFFGDYATRFGGEAAGDAALAHTAKSVRGKHYSGYRDFDAVRCVLD